MQEQHTSFLNRAKTTIKNEMQFANEKIIVSFGDQSGSIIVIINNIPEHCKHTPFIWIWYLGMVCYG